MAGLGLLAGCIARPPLPPPPQPSSMLELTRVPFHSLVAWRRSDPRQALVAFRRSCEEIERRPAESSLGGAGYAGAVADWLPVCAVAAEALDPSRSAARRFFQTRFMAYRMSREGLFTGYYEPELRGSRTRHGPYQTPLYGLPPDLVRTGNGVFRDTFPGPAGMVTATPGMRFVPYPPRAEIVRNGLPVEPLFYVDDPLDAFFLQIQGSGRIVLDDGSVVRAAYAGQNGHPYTAIGAVLVGRGALSAKDVSLQSIRAWLAAHPGEAQAVMNANASYVFFSERPIGDPAAGANGAQGVPLTPGASLAVDERIHAYGVPVWLESMAPAERPDRPDRKLDVLLVAQDTGGAIRGPVRGDVYWGHGEAAASVAGRMKHEGRMTVLLPRAVALRLGQHALFALP